MQTGGVRESGVQALPLKPPAAVSETQSPPIDHRDFSAIYRAYLARAQRWLRAHGVPDWDTEDVAQEVFAIVHKKLGRFDGTNLGGWIYAICRRKASDYRRRAWFRHAWMRRDEFSLESIPNQQGSPAASLETKERYALMWRILSKMTAKQRSVFVLFEVEGYSGQEIASLESIPEKTVWSRLARARAEFTKLERRLNAKGEGE